MLFCRCFRKCQTAWRVIIVNTSKSHSLHFCFSLLFSCVLSLNTCANNIIFSQNKRHLPIFNNAVFICGLVLRSTMIIFVPTPLAHTLPLRINNFIANKAIKSINTVPHIHSLGSGAAHGRSIVFTYRSEH